MFKVKIKGKHPFSTYAKFSEKLKFLLPSGNVSSSEIFEYLLKGWSEDVIRLLMDILKPYCCLSKGICAFERFVSATVKI